MKKVIVYESAQQKQLLELSLGRTLPPTVKTLVGGGHESAISVVRSLRVKGGFQVLLLVDIAGKEGEDVEEQLRKSVELIEQVPSTVPVKLVTFEPSLDHILLSSKSILEEVLEQPITQSEFDGYRKSDQTVQFHFADKTRNLTKKRLFRKVEPLLQEKAKSLPEMEEIRAWISAS